jgi:Carboxypeptidase regulatory-like domain
MKRFGLSVLVVLAACLLASSQAFAQGGGASTTGSINGKVADNSGGVLPGVTVSVTSPSLMGVQSSVTDNGGNYRFPALPPGTYTVTFELPGFSTLKREGIQIAMGFTAAVNVELSVASLQETVVVTGASPVIDTSSTRVQQNFKLEALQQIPNARDMWSLLAVTPGVSMQRTDVGGNRAGTQTNYQSYGYYGQNRVLIEGINTTEGTAAAGFYSDYGSFEEVFLGTTAQGAEMPTPGVQSQFLGKSGGNKFQGEFYQDYERNGFQSDNITGNVPARFLFSPTNTSGIRDGSNELVTYRDTNLNVGGPLKVDKTWWYFSYRNQKSAVNQPNFVGALASKTFDTGIWNASGKTTYQANKTNKLIGYYHWQNKTQPTRLPRTTVTYNDIGQTWKQISGSWIYKGEWNSTLSNNMYAEARYGVFGYYFPLFANSDTTEYQVIDTARAFTSGADRKGQTDRRRNQATGALTYFKDGWGGTHNFRVGGELLLETGWYGRTQGASGNVLQTFNNGVPSTVQVFFPTATQVGGERNGPAGNLLSIDKLNTYDAFISDQFSLGPATLSLGLRYDRYRSWMPEQRQLANKVGPLSILEQTFPEQTFATWNAFAPRVGVTYDLRGTGKSVVKANYGYYRHNPGVGLAGQANPNQENKNATYQWTDNAVCAGCIPGNGHYEVGEEGNQTGAALAGNITIDPDLKQPYSNQATLFFEQQLMEGVASRIGFVYYSARNQFGTFQPFRPASAYSVPFSVVDRGLDGLLGTADDGNVTFFGIPNAAIGNFPNRQVVMNQPDDGSYKTFEASLTKRMSHNFSVTGGFGYTWTHDYVDGFPNTPNGPFDEDYDGFGFKAAGSYQLPKQVLLSATYRFQTGPNYARQLVVAPPASCACTFSAGRGAAGFGGLNGGGAGTNTITSTTVYLTPVSAFRQDNISVFDIRAEKTLNLTGTTRLRLFFDAFNLLNAYAAETINFTTGTTFEQPTTILGPRTGRLGVRVVW